MSGRFFPPKSVAIECKLTDESEENLWKHQFLEVFKKTRQLAILLETMRRDWNECPEDFNFGSYPVMDALRGIEFEP